MMKEDQLSEKEMKDFIAFQQDEINATEIYKRLGMMTKKENNRKILLEMSQEELGHYSYIARYTGKHLKYGKWRVLSICFLARVFGLMFTLKLLEKDEHDTSGAYTKYPNLEDFAKTEDEHEFALLNMIDDNMLKYMSSIVLGLNDALVEFTGALAGYTLALSNCAMVALTGSITGIAAALSMGSSEYLSTKAETGDTKHALRSATYTSCAYLVTVFLLIAPYIWIPKAIVASAVMVVFAIIIIAIFNFYYSVVRDEKFKHRFTEMAIISLSVALLSFFIGYLLKMFTGIEG
jgi:VIT1/CCC1 family predicted Fe2+/Mn2+ transporter